MSTTKNEHNPDKLRPETVGEGWRLLTKGEVQEIGDEWWYGGEWCPVHQDNVGRHYEFTTTRRRSTPPADTTGSGREGETPETDRQVSITNQGVGHVSIVSADFARQLERQRDAALAQVEALRRDGERMNWLEKNAVKELKIDSDGTEVQLDRWHRKYITSHSWTGPTLRAAIDSAQRQEKP